MLAGWIDRFDGAVREQERDGGWIGVAETTEENVDMSALPCGGGVPRALVAPRGNGDQCLGVGCVKGLGDNALPVETARAQAAQLHADVAVVVAKIDVERELGGIRVRRVGAA